MTTIPTFTCKPGCGDCCGVIPVTAVERNRIERWLAAQKRSVPRARGATCPYRDAIAGCTIYPVRPFICRLYGTVARLRCPHGRSPDRLLTGKQERALLRAYRRDHGAEVTLL